MAASKENLRPTSQQRNVKAADSVVKRLKQEPAVAVANGV